MSEQDEQPTEQIPEDNPFRDQIIDLASDGYTWGEIHALLDEAYDPVDRAAFDECKREQPVFTVRASVYDADATSEQRWEDFETDVAQTEAEAVEEIRRRYPIYDVDCVEQTDSITVVD